MAACLHLIIFTIYTCNIVAMALLVIPEFRYQLESVPLALAGAGYGLQTLAAGLWSLKKASSAGGVI